MRRGERLFGYYLVGVLLCLFPRLPLCAQHRALQRNGEVLAHSLRFNPDEPTAEMPDALRELLRCYRTGKRYSPRIEGRAVAPLLKSVRHQTAPFNNSCPFYRYADSTYSASRCVSGCVATCIEQVVSYWQHPVALVDTLHGWTTDNYTIADILPGTPIDWSNILPDYSNGYTEAQAKAVADLTYYCGVAAHMNWTPGSSGTNLYRAFEPLWRAFDFQTLAFVQRGLYSNAAWDRLLRNELEQGRPICYTGHNMALSGHAFNIDGVDEKGYYHINWGYGGSYDGYFDLDFLNPFESTDDDTPLGQMEGFFSNQTALFMHPEDFVIDIYDTLSRDKALYGVRTDKVTFRRTPDTQGYVVADFQMTNETNESLNYTFEVLTYLPTDTAIFQQADYVALSSVNLAPGETKTFPVYCQFMESGDRIFALSADDKTLPFVLPLHIDVGTAPQLRFGTPVVEQVLYGDNLTARVSVDISNSAESGYAGNLVTYCLFEGDTSADDLRHWEVLSLQAGDTQTYTTEFSHLRDGATYILYVRCPWAVKASQTFVARAATATDAVTEVAESEEVGRWYDLSGRRTDRPVRGLYVKHGKKIWVR